MQKLVKGGQEDLPSCRGAQIYPSTFLFVGLTDLDFEEQSRWHSAYSARTLLRREGDKTTQVRLRLRQKEAAEESQRLLRREIWNAGTAGGLRARRTSSYLSWGRESRKGAPVRDV